MHTEVEPQIVDVERAPKRVADLRGDVGGGNRNRQRLASRFEDDLRVHAVATSQFPPQTAVGEGVEWSRRTGEAAPTVLRPVEEVDSLPHQQPDRRGKIGMPQFDGARVLGVGV
ncbi:MAG: hypothetical protein HY360_10440 [Verrucomicrobia bacterium]|nr:hypothetical protein [Verrucomicrobiota bacterium]